MRTIDLNCDAGESSVECLMSDDAAMFRIVSSANIACGGHAGDATTMRDTLVLAKQHQLGIGAHPSFVDKENFGRRRLLLSVHEIKQLVIEQIETLASIAAQQGTHLDHVKAHGALANMAAEDADIANAIARAVKAVDSGLIFLAIAGSEQQAAGVRAGLCTIAEGFADRAYDEQGQLVSRSISGAVIDDPTLAAARCVDMAMGKGLPRLDGEYIACDVQSICVHGDTPNAVIIAQRCRDELNAAGFMIRAFSA